MSPKTVPRSHQGRVGIQAGDPGTADATASDSQVQEATLGSAGIQGQGGLATGNGSVVTDQGQAGDQGGWVSRLESRGSLRAWQELTRGPTSADLEWQAGYHGDLIS